MDAYIHDRNLEAVLHLCQWRYQEQQKRIHPFNLILVIVQMIKAMGLIQLPWQEVGCYRLKGDVGLMVLSRQYDEMTYLPTYQQEQ